MGRSKWIGALALAVLLLGGCAGNGVQSDDIDTAAENTADAGNTAVEEPPAAEAGAAPAASQGGEDSSAASETEQLTLDAAKETALAGAGLTADQVTFTKEKLDWEDGRQVYDIEFHTAGGAEYDYEIDVETGKVVSYSYEAGRDAASAASDGAISADEAKELALAQVPGASLSDMRKFETEYDDGQLEYEGEIVYDGMEYEFEIDGGSGVIVSWDVEPAR